MHTRASEPNPLSALVSSSSGRYDAQTDNLINEAMAIAAEILARKPDLEILNKVAAVNRGEQPTRLRILRGESPRAANCLFGRLAYPMHVR
jgi:hypothetical protein